MKYITIILKKDSEPQAHRIWFARISVHNSANQHGHFEGRPSPTVVITCRRILLTRLYKRDKATV